MPSAGNGSPRRLRAIPMTATAYARTKNANMVATSAAVTSRQRCAGWENISPYRDLNHSPNAAPTSASPQTTQAVLSVSHNVACTDASATATNIAGPQIGQLSPNSAFNKTVLNTECNQTAAMPGSRCQV